MKENKVITDIEQLTPEWLTSIFRSKGYLSRGKVTKIIKKKSQETNTSNVYFLKVKFSNDAQIRMTSPEIIVKIHKFEGIPEQRIEQFRKDAKYEAKFYNIIAENIPEKPSIPMKIGLTITSLEKFHICAESNFLWYSHLLIRP